MDDEPRTPQEIWALIEHADEFVKYAQNRDPKAAYAQARETLERAAEAARTVPGAERLLEQAQKRLADIAKLESA
jgi:beta-phosphoglucomutase-like phosphatase (HAD superfamily)